MYDRVVRGRMIYRYRPQKFRDGCKICSGAVAHNLVDRVQGFGVGHNFCIGIASRNPYFSFYETWFAPDSITGCG